MSGDAHWDANTQWWVDGRMGQGGMWLLKKQYIPNFNTTPSPDPTTINFAINGRTVTNGKPANSVIGKYFFLPAAGYYGTYSTITPTPTPGPNNDPIDFKIGGYYHISTVRADGNGSFMYNLYFTSTSILMHTHSDYRRGNAAMLSWVVQ